MKKLLLIIIILFFICPSFADTKNFEGLKNSIKNNDPKNAKVYFDKIIEENPDIKETPDILYYSSQILIMNNDFEGAKKQIIKAIEKKQDEGLYYFELGKIYYKLNDYLRAINAFEYAIGENENLNSECYNYIGLSHYKKGNFKRALYNLDKAYSINKRIIYLYNLSFVYKSLNMVEKYEEVISEINSYEPVNVRDYIDLSSILYDKKDFEGAKNILLKGMAKYPESSLLNSAYAKLNKT